MSPLVSLAPVMTRRFDAVALNPQPLPPHETSATHRFDAATLNPQPLPPREVLASATHRLDAVALNPQPLPPRAVLAALQRLGLVADEQCGNVPRRLPHWPPRPKVF